MPATKEDHLLTCLSLSNILSYLDYDQVVRCMQVNTKMNDCINRNWHIMDRKNVHLIVQRIEGRTITEDTEVLDIFEDNRPNSANYTAKINTSASEDRFMLLHGSMGPWARLVMNKNIDVLSLMLEALLPRVNITCIETNVMGTYGNNTLKTLLDHLSKYYSEKHNNAVLKTRNDCLPVHYEIAKAMGASELKLFGVDFGHNHCFAGLDTKIMEILVDGMCYIPNQICELLKEWKSGARDVKLLKIKVAVGVWDSLCSQMEKTDKSGLGGAKSCQFYFELCRSIDCSVLVVSYHEKQTHAMIHIEQASNTSM